MLYTIAFTVLFLVALLLLSTISAFIRNYAIAKKIGLPVVIVPVSPSNPLWLLVGRHIMPLLRKLPFGSGNFTRFGYAGWQFHDKYRVHKELGDAITFATPGKNWIYVCNAETIHDVIRRERTGEFARPVELLAMLDVFGPNLSTTEGSDWQRQRKCTAASFNENSSALVWKESLRQGEQLLAHWKQAEKSRSTMASDMRTLALHVLVHAAFGKSFDFASARDDKTLTGPLSYRDALAIILENAILILALGQNTLKQLSFIPKLGMLSRAADQFKAYMAEMFDENSSHVQQQAQGNLISSLVRASVNDKLLSREEVFGNIFVYNFAGHDTTAHSFAFTFMLLAANPEVQDWMQVEIDHIMKNDNTLDAAYDLFPKFVRTLAVLLETLRLFHPLLSIIKGTSTQPARLKIGSQTITVPPNTRVLLNLPALHSHPKYWGEDSLEFNPSRWIKSKPGQGHICDREYIEMPSHEAYIPWSEGSRLCPGKKFSQVEHVAVMVAMFRDHCVVPSRREGESEEMARLRAVESLKDSGMVLLFQMLHPERTALEWKKRS